MTKKEEWIIIYILSKGMFFGFGFSYLINQAKDNMLLALLLGYLLGGIILYIFHKKDLSWKNNSTLFRLFMLFIASILFIFLILNLTNEISNFYLPETPPIFLIIPFCLVIFYGASKKMRGLTRLAEIIFPVTIILTIFGILANLPNYELTNFLPIKFNFNLDFINSVLFTTAFSIAPILLYFSLQKETSFKITISAYIASFLTVFLLSFSTIATLGINISSIFRYPEYIAFKKIQFIHFLERIENIISIFSFFDLAIIAILIKIFFHQVMKEKYSNIFLFIISCISVLFLSNIYQNTIINSHYIFSCLFFLFFCVFLTSKKSPG